jgi:cell division protein FtsB
VLARLLAQVEELNRNGDEQLNRNVALETTIRQLRDEHQAGNASDRAFTRFKRNIHL